MDVAPPTSDHQLDVGWSAAGSGEPARPRPLITLRHDRERYLALIEECVREITAGESYEVCLTNMIEAGLPADPWSCYQFLRRTNPVPFGALLSFGPLSVLSTSSERFLRVGREGVVESKPIKGTRPRGQTPVEDAALAAELVSSEKDRSENLMIVDLVRNDLGRCSRVGSMRASAPIRLLPACDLAIIEVLGEETRCRRAVDSLFIRLLAVELRHHRCVCSG